MYKVTIVGKEKVGKTTLKSRYLGKPINNELQSTIGVDYSTKIAEVHGESIKFQIWDLAGQKSFKLVRGPYFLNSAGFILVYALNDEKSLYALKDWILDISQQVSLKDKPLVFVANKSDLHDFDQNKAERFEEFKMKLISDLGFSSKQIDHVVTSALHGNNVQAVFDNLFYLVVA